jgi:hypothetical protein
LVNLSGFPKKKELNDGEQEYLCRKVFETAQGLELTQNIGIVGVN